MSSRTSSTIKLTVSRETRSFIELRSQAENFATPGELIDALVRDKIEQEKQLRLNQLLKEGWVSGRPRQVNAIFWTELTAEVKQSIKKSSRWSQGRKR